MAGIDRSSLPLAARPRRRPDIEEYSVQDGMILHTCLGGSNRAVALNETGRAIWRICDGERTIAEMIAFLMTQYEPGGQNLESDVRRTLNELHARDFLDLSHGGAV